MLRREIAPFREGTLFHERYRIIRCIKAGPRGGVYEVLDERTVVPRALKVIPSDIMSDANSRVRFEVESRVGRHLGSDHLVDVHATGIDEQARAWFVVMDLVRGYDLATMLVKRRGLPIEEAFSYLKQVAAGIDRMHAAGLVHRDLKPENLILARTDDGSTRIKIVDFGIVNIAPEGATGRAAHLLSHPFLSPEQIGAGGQVGPWSDLHALGHIAYALLAGEPYWTAETLKLSSPGATLNGIRSGSDEAPTKRAQRSCGVVIPPAFDAWFLIATAARPAARFDSAATMMAKLGRVVGTPRPIPAQTLPPMSVPLPSPAPVGPPPAPSARASLPAMFAPVTLPPLPFPTPLPPPDRSPRPASLPPPSGQGASRPLPPSLPPSRRTSLPSLPPLNPPPRLPQVPHPPVRSTLLEELPDLAPLVECDDAPTRLISGNMKFEPKKPRASTYKSSRRGPRRALGPLVVLALGLVALSALGFWAGRSDETVRDQKNHSNDAEGVSNRPPPAPADRAFPKGDAHVASSATPASETSMAGPPPATQPSAKAARPRTDASAKASPPPKSKPSESRQPAPKKSRDTLF